MKNKKSTKTIRREYMEVQISTRQLGRKMVLSWNKVSAKHDNRKAELVKEFENPKYSIPVFSLASAICAWIREVGDEGPIKWARVLRTIEENHLLAFHTGNAEDYDELWIKYEHDINLRWLFLPSPQGRGIDKILAGRYDKKVLTLQEESNYQKRLEQSDRLDMKLATRIIK
jgi:hypothetical protein